MAMDFSNVSNVAYGWLRNGLFWVIVALVLTCGAFAVLWWRKRTRMKYNALEVISFGNGKIGLNMHKAGMFKQKSTLGGLIDYGNEFRFKTDDGRIIRDASTDDLHDIFGKKSFLVRRKDDDPKILVPITRVGFKNEKLLMEIAPADFRDASVEIVAEATKETQGFLEKYLPYIMLGAIVVFFVISMILASQFFNRTVDKATELLTNAGQNKGSLAP